MGTSQHWRESAQARWRRGVGHLRAVQRLQQALLVCPRADPPGNGKPAGVVEGEPEAGEDAVAVVRVLVQALWISVVIKSSVPINGVGNFYIHSFALFLFYRMEQNLPALGLCILSFWLSAAKENFISGNGVNLSLTEMPRYFVTVTLGMNDSPCLHKK